VRIVAIFLPVLVLATLAHSATIRVPADQPSIQAGINAAAPGDTVEVACGVYTWTGEATGNSLGLIRLKDGVHLRSETGQAQCVTIDAEQLGRVFYCNGVDASTRLTGFTITGGLPTEPWPNDHGGGMYCVSSSLLVTDCTFTGNRAVHHGGAIYCSVSSPTITDCHFSENQAPSGGAIHTDVSPLTLVSCSFTDNSADFGGAIMSYPPPPTRQNAPALTDCVFVGNSAGNYGGALGGFYESVVTTTFADNFAEDGGAVLCYGDPEVSECVFVANTALRDGGGMYCGGSPTFTHCTFVENSAHGSGGGLYLSFFSSPVVENTLIAFSLEGEAMWCDSAYADPELRCCDIYGNEGGDWVTCIASQVGTDGNFSADPLFCDPENGNFTISSDSPCAPPGVTGCGLVGALPVGCGPIALEDLTWGGIKAKFRK
jgi:predicted outer membrane repeat protein